MATNKFGFNGEVKKLNIGKTFLKGYRDEFFHTIRYDFKPASVDSQKVGTMEMDNKEVTLSVPHVESAGSSQAAVFKGNKIPASKDCVLVIDHTTGEIVLERISQNIRVKKTRTERNNKPSVPPPFANPVTARGLHHHKPSKPKSHTLSTAKSSNSSSNHPPAPGSMPMIIDENKNESESSSDSDSGSSSSSDSDSDSDQGPTNKSHNPHQKSPTSILSDLELSEED